MQSRNRLADFETKIYGDQRGRCWERAGLGVWDWHVNTEVHGMTGQQEPAAGHRELYPTFWDQLRGKSI